VGREREIHESELPIGRKGERKSKYLRPIKTVRSPHWMPRPALKTPNMLGSGVRRSTNARYYQCDRGVCQMVSGRVARGLGRRAGRRADRRIPCPRPVRQAAIMKLLGLSGHHRDLTVVSLFDALGSDLPDYSTELRANAGNSEDPAFDRR
jgi:hypothetical protein